MEQKYRADREAQAISYKVDKQANEYEISNRYEVKGEAMKEMFERKLKKYEKQILEVEQNYKRQLATSESLLQNARIDCQVHSMTFV